MKEKVVLSWGGGKDSTMALYKIKKGHEYQVSALLATITSDYDRVSMHGIKRVLLEQQAESLRLPVEKIFIGKNCSNQEYDDRIREILLCFRKEGISYIAFGDIFLEDITKYREKNLEKIRNDRFYFCDLIPS